ncbi:mpv17-like protein 2 isoform X1 [Epinephelus lanceolatus]|uniref:mpv17-like protein 2 isoform X1 n=1 Tax=Epinephelus lanceolatus TaxID=310571 RepID=UPI00144756A1|nr:mpv17-like protein 2 isoform X1 [Epinephelus lanceolatus]
MLPQLGKNFLVRIRLNWRPLFQNRTLLLTNTLSAGGMLALGDIVQQTWENFKKPGRVRDWRRTGKMLTFGCSLGPVQHGWYIWLDGLFVGNTLKAVGKKVLVDMLVGAPVVGIVFFMGLGLMEGHTLSEGWTEFREKFWEFYTAECTVWPAAQMFNFYFLSLQYRVVFINFISLGWDTYLSYLKHRVDSPPTELVSDSSAVDVQQEMLPPPKPLKEKA